MSKLSLLELKARSKAKENAEKEKQNHKRSVLVLVHDYLVREGYSSAASMLQSEGGNTVQRYEVADNMSLNDIVSEFNEYHQFKFERKPKLIRRCAGEASGPQRGGSQSRRSVLPHIHSYASVERLGSASRNHARSRPAATTQTRTGAAKPSHTRSESYSRGDMRSMRRSSASRRSAGRRNTTGRPQQPRMQPRSASLDASHSTEELSVAGGAVANEEVQAGVVKYSFDAGEREPRPQQRVDSGLSQHNNRESKVAVRHHTSYGEEDRVMRPLPAYTGQLRELAALISRDIYTQNPNVGWNDVVELHEAKQLLKEAVVMPLMYPSIFTGLLQPWKGILLYGPPGTGKTMLAKAVAAECRTTFFNISASSIVSKFRGDSEKLVRVLFELARYHAPSTIFIDEIDSIMSQRGASSGSEHEGSRRMKTELLVQMDGLNKSNDLVFVLCASNLPWELDTALLRRLEKRIHIPLPTVRGRAELLQKLVPPLTDLHDDQQQQEQQVRGHELDYQVLALQTEGYSCSDLTLLSKEAAMRPVRRLMTALFDSGKSRDELSQIPVSLDAVTGHDFGAALKVVKPSCPGGTVQRYKTWHAQFGSGASLGNTEKGGEFKSPRSDGDPLFDSDNLV